MEAIMAHYHTQPHPIHMIPVIIPEEKSTIVDLP